MIQLHYFPSNASMTPHMVLEELGVPYELVLVDRTNNAHHSPEYLKLNPNGKIPVLVDGELVLYETAAITLHLADTHAGAGLAPPLGTPERAHFYKWLMWLSNTLQAEMPLYFYSDRWADTPEAAAALKRHAEVHITGMVDQLDAELARHGGPWFLGERYSVLDPYVLMLCRWTRGMARPARTLPHLGPYLQRMLARPAVQRAYVQEGLGEPRV
ncbi:glutathione S-transferase family protein [Piscinibacter sp.]|jgi:glutathione S-transferase|uniref:glutathione S-transferase family protein n=1 Tax=Piscinibacter sp. TaxID=1903157 RepID=UPI001B6ECDBF|nr:glutathione S-transferase family protein [Piscinibacter sp.]MBK7532107.1 glutathione S-transferase family protein [Piscinibacter sp.]MBP6543467.1 glutathione S-transferase family protein [Piscinibacter sp.]HOY35912.1 glutathione S-transferase family protein [Piscinibacter sp.]